MFCTRCGSKAASDEARFCHVCGMGFHMDGTVRQTGYPTDQDPDSMGKLPHTKMPSGIGGWLLVLIGVLMAAVPIMSMASVFSHLAILEHLYPSITTDAGWDGSGWRIYQSSMWLAAATFAALSIYASLRLLNGRSRKDVEVVTEIIWVIGLGASAVVNVLIPFVLHSTERLMYEYIGPTGAPLVGSILGGLLFSLIWSSYLSKSVRVRNTYCQPRPKGAHPSS